MIKEFSPEARSNNLVVQELKNEVLVYDFESQKAICLNQTAALVWQACDGIKSIPQIKTSLSKRLNSEVSEDLVWLAIDQLIDENLIINGDKLPDTFAGMNRREVIKKVGLATLVTIPFITSLVAPTAAMAASCVPNGTIVGSLTEPFECSTTPISVTDFICQGTYGTRCCSGQAHFERGSANPGNPCMFQCSCF